MSSPPRMQGFKPIGLPMTETRQVNLHFEEYESIVLADHQHLSQAEAAAKMDISRPTFTRIYDSARQKVAQALAEGMGIMIQGGDVAFDKEWYRCNSCHQVFHQTAEANIKVCPNCGAEDITHINAAFNHAAVSGHRRRNQGQGKGPGGICICPQCGAEVPHKRGVSCARHRCGKCNIPMQRK